MKESAKQQLLEICTDYLMISTSLCTVTGLTDLTGETISPDKISRLLNSGVCNSMEVLQKVKPLIREVALSRQDKLKGKYVKIETLKLESLYLKGVWIEQVDFPLLVNRQVFKNEDRSRGILYLGSRDIGLTYEQITAIFQKRLKVED